MTCSLSKNSCAIAFGNWSRGKHFGPKKSRVGGGGERELNETQTCHNLAWSSIAGRVISQLVTFADEIFAG